MDKRTLAVEHVLAQGDPVLRWRAMRLAGREVSLPPTEEIVQHNADGGATCPFFVTPESSIGATSRMLCDLAFWGAGNTEACRRGIAFAWGHQQPDGRWTEAPIAGSSPPPWFMPKDLRVDLWITANMAAALVALGYGGDPRLRKAVEWTERHVQPEGGFPGFIHTTYGMASAQYRLGAMDRAEQHLRHAIAYLQPTTDVHDINWGLLCFSLGAIPRWHPTVSAHIDQLVATQDEDGFWSTMYGDAREFLTIEALERLDAYSSFG